jgi:hypothetical protein
MPGATIHMLRPPLAAHPVASVADPHRERYVAYLMLKQSIYISYLGRRYALGYDASGCFAVPSSAFWIAGTWLPRLVWQGRKHGLRNPRYIVVFGAIVGLLDCGSMAPAPDHSSGNRSSAMPCSPRTNVGSSIEPAVCAKNPAGQPFATAVRSNSTRRCLTSRNSTKSSTSRWRSFGSTRIFFFKRHIR